MSGLFPAGSEEGEEERTGEENRRGGMPARARFIPGGSSKGRSSRLHQAVRQKACPSVQTHRRLIRTDGTDVRGVFVSSCVHRDEAFRIQTPLLLCGGVEVFQR